MKKKISLANKGKIRTPEPRENISIGRKKMLEEAGGFTIEHRQNLSKATIQQYQQGFMPELHHVKGWHESSKAGKVFFRSSYEKKAYLILDDNILVESYQVEAVSAVYIHPVKNIECNYLIDILVNYKDGSQRLVEIKPYKWLNDDIIKAKIEAGISKSKELGIKFEVWSEAELFGDVYNERQIRDFVKNLKESYK